MSEETNNIPKIGKKSHSPSKTISNEDKNKVITKNLTEQKTDKSKTFLLSSVLTKEYTDEEEVEGITITYRDPERKIKSITLDLLLKKIVTENFIEKNPIQIFSFCQQCYCFMDKDIMFNKIINCYNYYKEKKIPITQIGNLIKFLNILVIEMYEYYTKVNLDDPIIILLKNYYNSIIIEISNLISKNEEMKKNKEENEEEVNIEDEENFNINDYQNKLEEYNEEEQENDDNIDVFKDRNSELIVDNKDLNRERYGTITGRKEEGRFSSYREIEEKKEKEGLSRNTINMSYKTFEKDEEKSKKDKKKEEKERKKLEKEKKKEEKQKKKEEKQKKKEEEKQRKKEEKGDKKGFGFHFFHVKKDKPVKIQNKNSNEEDDKIDEIQEKMKLVQALKKASYTPEEEIFNSLGNIILLFSLETPNKRDIKQAKSNIDFYKDINKKIAQMIGKPLPEGNNRHLFSKSVTVNNVSKKPKLKLHENEGFFNVLDWDQVDIGEKLIQISKQNINKVHRRELYKAIFLKKDKQKMCPNVMDNIDKFNRLTFFIIENILSYDFAKDRGKIMEKWIVIADYCKSRKDYNDCIAINSALNNYIITGLKKTIKDIGKDKEELLKQIKRFCKYQGNYKKMREDMKSLNSTDFYIPYLGMILKDLAFYEENSKYITDGIFINFEKLEKVQYAVSEFFNFKNTIDKENPTIPEELNFFEKLEDIKEADMEELANNLEPEFKLYTNKKREKRQTNIDKKYFGDNTVTRPNMRDSKKLSHK